MSVLKNVFIFLLCVAGIATGVSFVLPSTWEITREVQIPVDAYTAHAYIDDLSNWRDWCPWGSAVDPSVQLTTSPRSRGVGAELTWNGKQVGRGSLKISMSDDAKGVGFDARLRGGHEPVKGMLELRDLASGATVIKFTLRGDVSRNPVGRYFALLRNYSTGPEIVDALTRLRKRLELGR